MAALAGDDEEDWESGVVNVPGDEEEEDWESAEVNVPGGEDEGDDWEALLDDDEEGEDEAAKAPAVLTPEESLKSIESLKIESVKLSRALGVAIGLKMKSENISPEITTSLILEVLESVGDKLTIGQLESLKTLLRNRKINYNSAKQAAAIMEKKKAAAAEVTKKKKKKKKKKKSQVYSAYDDEDDPELWGGLDETSERYMDSYTHKSSRNYGKDW